MVVVVANLDRNAAGFLRPEPARIRNPSERSISNPWEPSRRGGPAPPGVVVAALAPGLAAVRLVVAQLLPPAGGAAAPDSA